MWLKMLIENFIEWLNKKMEGKPVPKYLSGKSNE
tara:strand:+ start:3393 stop:3494 length:102 start_codon:yes stop_codon:yes gene_type:complete